MRWKNWRYDPLVIRRVEFWPDYKLFAMPERMVTLVTGQEAKGIRFGLFGYRIQINYRIRRRQQGESKFLKWGNR